MTEESQFHAAFDTVPTGILIVPHNGRVWFNRAFCAMLGYQPEELAQTGMRGITHPDDRLHDQQEMTRLLHSGIGKPAQEQRFIHRNGTEVWGLLQASVITDSTGAETRILGTVTDITHRKVLEARLGRSAATLRSFICQAPVALAMFDRDMGYIATSRLWTDAFGAGETADGDHPHFEAHGAQSETWRAACRRGLSGETLRIDQNQWVRADGSSGWYRLELRPWHDADGRIGGIVIFAEDITEIKLAQRQTDSMQQQFRHLFESAPDAIIMVDRAGRVRLANRKTEDMFGYTSSELVEQPVELLVNPDGRHHHETLRKAFVDSQSQSAMGDTRNTLMGHRRDGTEFPVEISLSRFIGEGDEYIIASVRDVTARLQAQADRMAREVAEEASQAKSLFLATMSHEIRTPLSAVLGLAEVLGKSDLSHDQAQLLGIMRDSADHLLRLIDDVLDFSKIEAGSLEIEQAPVDLPELIEGAARGLASHAAAQGVALHLFVAPEMPQRVLADAVRLRQIIYNLLGNAIKFSSGADQVSGRTSLRAELEPGTTPVLRLVFSDNGIGMRPDVLNALFRPFTQAEATTTRKFGGTGLGLSICKRIIDRLGGEIALQSEPQKGSTFTVRLPLTLLPDGHAKASARLAGLTCLLAECDACERADLQRSLEHEGARVVLLRGGDKGRTEGIDLAQAVLITGAEAPLPEDLPPTLPQVRIGHEDARRLAIRGRGSVQINARAMTRADLVNAVALALGREAIAGASTDTLHAGDVAPIFADPSNAPLILVAEDDPLNQRVIRHQLDLLGLRAEIAGDGAKALQKWREGHHAVLLTDLHMPNMDGYALTTAIRAEEARLGAGSRLPILALTANALRDEVSRARSIGLDGYLTKPIALARLADALRPWLALGTGPEVTERASAPSTTSCAIDTSVHDELIGADKSAVRDFLTAYREVSVGLVARFCECVISGDSAAAAMIAHQLKSSSRWIGARRFGDLCELLQASAHRDETGTLVARLAEFNRQHAAVLTEIDLFCAEGND